MPRPTPYERARLWVERMDAAVAGSGGHNATFSVALALMQGFDLAHTDARAILDEYNQRCDPAWSDSELEHKLRQADKQAGYRTTAGVMPRGYLRDQGGRDEREAEPAPYPLPPRPAPKKAEFDPAKLQRVAGDFAKQVDLVWLANRSHIDPALVSSAKFLATIYKPGEHVLAFSTCDKEGNAYTQGEAVWPAESLPTTGKNGVWFLCQPVTGQYQPNPRGKMRPDGTIAPSRRIEECVTDWRFMVLESDEAPPRLWLGALVQLPLRISAIYTSGGRSVHALIRIDASTKAQWDAQKHAMKAGLVTLGADPNAMSAVRLTRLPGTFREGKFPKDEQGRHTYQAFPSPSPQKLLYLNPDPPLRALADQFPVRDVEADWLKLATAAPSDLDTGVGADRTKEVLAFYATVSRRLRHVLANFGTPAAAFPPPLTLETGEPAQSPAPRCVIRWKGDAIPSYLCRVWSIHPKTNARSRKWSFEECPIEEAESFASEEAALTAYDDSGIARRDYVEAVQLPPRTTARFRPGCPR